MEGQYENKLKESVYGHWPDSSNLERRPEVVLCEHGNESSDFIKSGEILDHLSNYQHLHG